MHSVISKEDSDGYRNIAAIAGPTRSKNRFTVKFGTCTLPDPFPCAGVAVAIPAKPDVSFPLAVAKKLFHAAIVADG